MTHASFETAFPRLWAVQPFMFLGPTLAWASEFTWSDDDVIARFCRIVIEQQRNAATQNIEWLSEIADAAILDLNDQLEGLDPERDKRDYRVILFFRMIMSVIPMRATLALGQRGACYDWAQRGLSTEYDPSRRYNAGYSYLPFIQADDARIAAISFEMLPDWCVAFFLNARDLGSPRSEIVAEFAEPCWDICLDILDMKAFEGSKLVSDAILALASIASWAVMHDQPLADQWVARLVEVWHGDKVPRSVRPTLASTFITRANPATGKSYREWGELILRDYGDVLREHERLMFLTATVESREQWRALRKDILGEIKALVHAANTAGVHGADRLFARESRVDLIKPLLRTLVDAEDIGAVMDVLTAWYTEPGNEPCDDNVLFVNLAYRDGVAVLWPGGAWINARTTPSGHELVVEALHGALGIETDPARGAIIDEKREGMPDYPKGAEIERAMLDYYRLGEVAAGFKTMAKPRSLVVFPTVADPLQGLIGRELGLTLPLEVSLAQALPNRPVRRVSIWPGSTYYTDFEVDALKAFGQLQGWRVDVFDTQAGAAADFRRFYEQAEPDLLWVAGHGEFVAHRPDESGIVLEPRPSGPSAEPGAYEILPMQEVAQFGIPQGSRRLLVLNTCNGATTQGMAGMARIGLAQNIVQPAQAVIGHLWPASQAVSLAFGMLFASNLGGKTIEAAFARTIAEMRVPADIPARLTERLGRPPEGLFRIERDAGELSSILAWGCPVLLT